MSINQNASPVSNVPDLQQRGAQAAGGSGGPNAYACGVNATTPSIPTGASTPVSGWSVPGAPTFAPPYQNVGGAVPPPPGAYHGPLSVPGGIFTAPNTATYRFSLSVQFAPGTAAAIGNEYRAELFRLPAGSPPGPGTKVAAGGVSADAAAALGNKTAAVNIDLLLNEGDQIIPNAFQNAVAAGLALTGDTTTNFFSVSTLAS